MCLSDINEKLGEESLRELSQQFGEDMVTFQVCDVTKEDSVKTLIEEAERKLNSSLYCFINNAGIRFYPGAPVNWTPRITKSPNMVMMVCCVGIENEKPSRDLSISIRSYGGEGRLEALYGHQPDWSLTRNQLGYEVENRFDGPEDKLF